MVTVTSLPFAAAAPDPTLLLTASFTVTPLGKFALALKTKTTWCVAVLRGSMVTVPLMPCEVSIGRLKTLAPCVFLDCTETSARLALPLGVTFTGALAGPTPLTLAAVTEQAYCVPLVRPVTVMGEPAAKADPAPTQLTV